MSDMRHFQIARVELTHEAAQHWAETARTMPRYAAVRVVPRDVSALGARITVYVVVVAE